MYKIVCFAVLLAVASARVTREVATEDYWTQTRQKLQEIGNHVNEMLKDAIPQEDKISEILKSGTQLLADKATEAANKLDSDVKSLTNSTVADAVKQSITNLQTLSEKLRNDIENNKDIKAWKETLATGIKKAVDEGQKLTESLQPSADGKEQSIGTWAQEAIDKVVKATGALEKKIHEATGHKAADDHSAHH